MTAWQVFRESCGRRRGLPVERRPANALNIEIGQAQERCTAKTPREWQGKDPDGSRWLASGGSPLVLGLCSANCPELGRLSDPDLASVWNEALATCARILSDEMRLPTDEGRRPTDVHAPSMIARIRALQALP